VPVAEVSRNPGPKTAEFGPSSGRVQAEFRPSSRGVRHGADARRHRGVGRLSVAAAGRSCSRVAGASQRGCLGGIGHVYPCGRCGGWSDAELPNADSDRTRLARTRVEVSANAGLRLARTLVWLARTRFEVSSNVGEVGSNVGVVSVNAGQVEKVQWVGEPVNSSARRAKAVLGRTR
jgi:hypothetical protein